MRRSRTNPLRRSRTSRPSPGESQRQPACDHQQVLPRTIALERTARRMYAESVALHEDHQLGVRGIETEALPRNHDFELTHRSRAGHRRAGSSRAASRGHSPPAPTTGHARRAVQRSAAGPGRPRTATSKKRRSSRSRFVTRAQKRSLERRLEYVNVHNRSDIQQCAGRVRGRHTVDARRVAAQQVGRSMGDERNASVACRTEDDLWTRWSGIDEPE